jgi:hypothetical protein
MNYAVIWIDTNGLFSIHNCPTLERAATAEQIVSDSGLPVLVMSRDKFIEKAADIRLAIEESD